MYLSILQCLGLEADCCGPVSFALLNDKKQEHMLPLIKVTDRTEFYGQTTIEDVQIMLNRAVTQIDDVICCLNGKHELEVMYNEISCTVHLNVHLYNVSSIAINENLVESFNAKMKITIT